MLIVSIAIHGIMRERLKFNCVLRLFYISSDGGEPSQICPPVAFYRLCGEKKKTVNASFLLLYEVRSRQNILGAKYIHGQNIWPVLTFSNQVKNSFSIFFFSWKSLDSLLMTVLHPMSHKIVLTWLKCVCVCISVLNKGQMITKYFRWMCKAGGYVWMQATATLTYSKNSTDKSFIFINQVLR